MNRIFILILCVFFALLTAANAGEIYTYKDKDGNTVISNTPVPEKYQGKAKKIDSYERNSPEEIQSYEAGRKANIQRQEAESSRNRQANEAQEAARKQNDRQQAQQQKLEQQQQKQAQQQKEQDEIKCHSFSPHGSPYTWEHCYKNGKLVSKKRI